MIRMTADLHLGVLQDILASDDVESEALLTLIVGSLEARGDRDLALEVIKHLMLRYEIQDLSSGIAPTTSPNPSSYIAMLDGERERLTNELKIEALTNELNALRENLQYWKDEYSREIGFNDDLSEKCEVLEDELEEAYDVMEELEDEVTRLTNQSEELKKTLDASLRRNVTFANQLGVHIPKQIRDLYPDIDIHLKGY
jgi:hypothetical protein